MTIQFNTDKNINGTEKFRAPFISSIEKELSHFSAHITRIEAHLTDENGPKTGKNDKRCLLEARLEGRQPIAVTHHADSYEQAVEGAIDKLKISLEKIVGHLRNH